MRLIIMFDLPMLTENDRRSYSVFRSFLLKSGFFMMQESIYCKLNQNQSDLESVLNRIRSNAPNRGVIQALTITEKQFSKIEYISGSPHTDVIHSTDRIIFL